MKTKKFNTSLTLKKRTVSHLDESAMKDVKGGSKTYTHGILICPTFQSAACPF